MIAGSGGLLGTICRFLASRYLFTLFVSTFPFATFIINIAGCLLIGIIFGLTQKSNFLNAEWILFLTVGFCGGFTTFSAFALENLTLLNNGNSFHFALYTGLSIFLGIMATWLGHWFIVKTLVLFCKIGV